MTRFAAAVEPVAVSVRNGYEESVHHGAGVALDADGDLLASVGDPDLDVFPRSSLKPLQAYAMVAVGLELSDRQLAVACASHDGSPEHLAVVREILDRYDLDEADLDNTPARPLDADARGAARLAGVGPTSLQQNCSGKHAAMLATCRVNGWPLVDYRRLDHPVQVAIDAGLADLGCVVTHVGIDGCGAPAHSLALRQLARAFARVAVEDGPVARAMRAHPALVAGPKRDVTRWMTALPGLVCKDGAEGVFAAAFGDGRSVAFKVAGGSGDARQAVVPQALRSVGVDVDGVADVLADLVVPVLGHGRPVGDIRPLGWHPSQGAR